MLKLNSWLIIFFITHILDCFIFAKVDNNKFKINMENIILILAFSIVDSYFNEFYNPELKIFVTNLSTFLLLKIIYNKSNSSTLMTTIFIYLAYALSEIIFCCVFVILLNIDINFVSNNHIGIFLTNLVEFINVILIFNIKFVKKFISKIIKWYDNKKNIELITAFIITIIISYLLIYLVLFSVKKDELSVVYLSILFSMIIFIGGYFKEKSGNNKLNIKYGNLLEYSKNYEDVIVEKSKKQHEYKNQLTVIEQLIPKSNKKAKSYIKTIIDDLNDVKDDEWLLKLRKFPSGGVKGLLHLKITKMIKNNITVFVYIDEKLSRKKSWIKGDKDLEDISQIFGVYLDNAIEASINSKDKQIIIEFIQNDNNIEFCLSNTYSGNIDFKNIDNEGYSTKGIDRGYGLPLVNDIVKRNILLDSKREINGRFFVQKLYMKK